MNVFDMIDEEMYNERYKSIQIETKYLYQREQYYRYKNELNDLMINVKNLL